MKNSVSSLQRLYSRSHEFITKPVDNICYLGISDWAIRYLVTFTFIRFDYNPKTLFSYYNQAKIDEFLKRVEAS